jgi:hypothetical protein
LSDWRRRFAIPRQLQLQYIFVDFDLSFHRNYPTPKLSSRSCYSPNWCTSLFVSSRGTTSNFSSLPPNTLSLHSLDSCTPFSSGCQNTRGRFPFRKHLRCSDLRVMRWAERPCGECHWRIKKIYHKADVLVLQSGSSTLSFPPP